MAPLGAVAGRITRGVAPVPGSYVHSTRGIAVRSSSTSTASARHWRNDHPDHPYVKDTFVIETKSGRTFRVLDTRRFPPVKPNLIRKRIEKLKSYVGVTKDIRHSPWRMNLVCQMVAGLTVPEAFKQLQFCDKTKAPPFVYSLLRKTMNKAALKDGLQPSQLEVAECFTTKGTPLKRIKYHARGRYVSYILDHTIVGTCCVGVVRWMMFF